MSLFLIGITVGDAGSDSPPLMPVVGERRVVIAEKPDVVFLINPTIVVRRFGISEPLFANLQLKTEFVWLILATFVPNRIPIT